MSLGHNPISSEPISALEAPADTGFATRFVSAPQGVEQGYIVQSMNRCLVVAAVITVAGLGSTETTFGTHELAVKSAQNATSKVWAGVPPTVAQSYVPQARVSALQQAYPDPATVSDVDYPPDTNFNPVPNIQRVSGRQQDYTDAPSMILRGVPPAIALPVAGSERWSQSTEQFYQNVASSLTKQFFGPQFTLQARVSAPQQAYQDPPSRIEKPSSGALVIPQPPITQRVVSVPQNENRQPSSIWQGSGDQEYTVWRTAGGQEDPTTPPSMMFKATGLQAPVVTQAVRQRVFTPPQIDLRQPSSIWQGTGDQEYTVWRTAGGQEDVFSPPSMMFHATGLQVAQAQAPVTQRVNSTPQDPRTERSSLWTGLNFTSGPVVQRAVGVQQPYQDAPSVVWIAQPSQAVTLRTTGVQQSYVDVGSIVWTTYFEPPTQATPQQRVVAFQQYYVDSPSFETPFFFPPPVVLNKPPTFAGSTQQFYRDVPSSMTPTAQDFYVPAPIIIIDVPPGGDPAKYALPNRGGFGAFQRRLAKQDEDDIIRIIIEAVRVFWRL